MANSLACKQCGTLLDEDSGVEPERRKPCPVCGSKMRQFSMQAEGGLYFLGGLASFTVIRNAASLLLQALIVPGAKTDEGQLIEAVALPWFKIIESLKDDSSLAFQIKPRQWEEIIAGAYQRAGFDEVTL